ALPVAHAVRLHVPASTDIYALSLHDALPILAGVNGQGFFRCTDTVTGAIGTEDWWIELLFRGHNPSGANGGLLSKFNSGARWQLDRKSTRLNSSHVKISYAVFCLKKKKIDEH